MKLYYPVIFLKEDDGRYLVSFSDVPEAITCGNDFENIDIKETVVKIELNLTGLDDKKTNFIIIKLVFLSSNPVKFNSIFTTVSFISIFSKSFPHVIASGTSENETKYLPSSSFKKMTG